MLPARETPQELPRRAEASEWARWRIRRRLFRDVRPGGIVRAGGAWGVVRARGREVDFWGVGSQPRSDDVVDVLEREAA